MRSGYVVGIAVAAGLLWAGWSQLPALLSSLQGPAWSYVGKSDGPDAWGALSPDFALCAQGKRQSPIALPATTGKPDSTPPARVMFQYKPTPIIISDTGHTVLATDGEDAGHLLLDDEKYAYESVHFHAPGEHSVGGERTRMEAHLVHRDAGGRTVNVAVRLVAGTENPVVKALWTFFPVQPGPPVVRDKDRMDPGGLLPASREFYLYEGSTGAPPCREGVRWLVMKDPVEVSEEQIARFESRFAGSRRPEQPWHDRQVRLVTGQGVFLLSQP